MFDDKVMAAFIVYWQSLPSDDHKSFQIFSNENALKLQQAVNDGLLESPEGGLAEAFHKALLRQQPKPEMVRVSPIHADGLHDPFAVPVLKPPTPPAWMQAELMAGDGVVSGKPQATKTNTVFRKGPIASVVSAARGEVTSVVATRKRRVRDRLYNSDRKAAGVLGQGAKPAAVKAQAKPGSKKRVGNKGHARQQAYAPQTFSDPKRPVKASIKRQSFLTPKQQKQLDEICKIYGKRAEDFISKNAGLKSTGAFRYDERTFGDRLAMSFISLTDARAFPEHLYDNEAEARAHIEAELKRVESMSVVDDKLEAFFQVKALFEEYKDHGVLPLGDKFSRPLRKLNERILNDMLRKVVCSPRYGARVASEGVQLPPLVISGLRVESPPISPVSLSGLFSPVGAVSPVSRSDDALTASNLFDLSASRK